MHGFNTVQVRARVIHRDLARQPPRAHAFLATTFLRRCPRPRQQGCDDVIESKPISRIFDCLEAGSWPPRRGPKRRKPYPGEASGLAGRIAKVQSSFAIGRVRSAQEAAAPPARPLTLSTVDLRCFCDWRCERPRFGLPTVPFPPVMKPTQGSALARTMLDTSAYDAEPPRVRKPIQSSAWQPSCA